MSGIRANLGGHGTSPSSSSPSVHLQLFLLVGFLASVAEADTTDFDPSVAISPDQYLLVVISSSIFLIFLLVALICSVYREHRYEEEGSSLARILSTLTREERAVATPWMPSPWRPGPPRGLDPALIEAFPELLYAAVKDHKLGKGALECAVCLDEFDDDDSLRLLPKCDHVFHADCIDAWLAYHTTCPVCRAGLRSSDAAARPLPSPAAAAPASPPAHVVIAVDESRGRPDSAEDCERFALRLPEHIRRDVMNWNLRRPMSPAVFPGEKSAAAEEEEASSSGWSYHTPSSPRRDSEAGEGSRRRGAEMAGDGRSVESKQDRSSFRNPTS